MNKFTFVLPDGQTFELKGTAETTREQAERIFNEQLAAGALIGLRRGDTIENVQAKFVDFTLSRLDRGTAGVDDLPLLAINNQDIISALPVVEAPVNEPIDVADFVAQTPVLQPLGPLTPTQVQALVAAAAKNPGPGVGKYGLTIPQLESAGVVKPGTGCRYAGIPNTPITPANTFTENSLTVLESPTVWTGALNLNSLDDFLANETAQDRIQEGLIRSSYQTLVETGQIQTAQTSLPTPVGAVYTGAGSTLTTALAIGTSLLSSGAPALRAGVNTLLGSLSTTNFSNIGTSIDGVLNGFGKGLSNITARIGNLSFDSVNTASLGSLSLDKITGSISNLANRGVSELGGLLNNASKFGVETATAWAKGLDPAGLTNQLNGLFKQGQFSINFADFKIPTTLAGVAPAAGFRGTTNRQTVDLATAKIIGSSKIPTPSFGSTSIDDALGGIGASLGSINPASFVNKLGGLNISSITNQVGNLPNLGTLTPSLGALNQGIASVTGINGPVTSFGQTLTGTAGLPTSIGGITTNSTAARSTTTVDFAARQQAVNDLNARRSEYEALVAQYGRLDSRTEAAFTAYQRALANLDNFA